MGPIVAGPWYVGDEYDCRLSVCVDVAGERHTVAEVMFYDGYPPGERGEAHAKLIAAAPEMADLISRMIPALLGRPVAGDAFSLVAEARALLAR